jgi:hypothetical protein
MFRLDSLVGSHLIPHYSIAALLIREISCHRAVSHLVGQKCGLLSEYVS